MEMHVMIELLGGQSRCARRCGISRQAVLQWERVPAQYVLMLASGSPLRPHDIRPDLYPHPLDGTRGAKGARTRRIASTQ